MADIVNLRRARKAKARRTAEADAAARSAQFGRSRSQKTREKTLRDKAAKTIDAHKLDDENG